MIDITEKVPTYAIVTIEYGAHFDRTESLPDWNKEYNLHDALERMHELNKGYGNKTFLNEHAYRSKREAKIIHYDEWKDVKDSRNDTVAYLTAEGEAHG